MAATVKWHFKLYDLDGNPLSMDYSNNFKGGPSDTNEVLLASGRSLTYVLNGVDECQFTVSLDDPAAYQMTRLKTVVKLFREVDDPDRGVSLLGGDPCFCGIIGSTIKSGQANQMTVKAFNPLWRLQFRFHLLNHYLEINPDTTELYTQSELIWKLIDLVNNAFGDASFTGVDRGTFEWGAGEPTATPYFVGKGSKTWAHIFDTILQRPASVDIFPVYVHTDGDPTLMQLNTMEKRGLDKSSALKFNYRTVFYDSNLDDLTEEATVQPDEFGNYLWAVGMGGPNSGKYAAVTNSNPYGDGYEEIGIYMALTDHSDIKRQPDLVPIADAELKMMKHPQDAYTITVNSSGLLYYDYDYVLGDVAALNASRGALFIDNKKQRIYSVVLSMSENNLESAEILVANDFYGKVTGIVTDESPASAPPEFVVTILGDTIEGDTLTAVPV